MSFKYNTDIVGNIVNFNSEQGKEIIKVFDEAIATSTQLILKYSDSLISIKGSILIVDGKNVSEGKQGTDQHIRICEIRKQLTLEGIELDQEYLINQNIRIHRDSHINDNQL